MNPALNPDRRRLAAFCRKWKVGRLLLFGSALRDDFGPDSDVDLVAEFAADGVWGLFDLVRMQQELCGIFGRHVDLLTRKGVERMRNPLRRDAILASLETLYAA